MDKRMIAQQLDDLKVRTEVRETNEKKHQARSETEIVRSGMIGMMLIAKT
jgi:hypothetical protein